MGLRSTLSRFISRSLERTVDGIFRFLKYDKTSLLEIGSLEGYEVAYRRGTSDEKVLARGLDDNRFFAAAPGYTLADEHVIIDVGAHIGAFALPAAAKVPNGRVHAIEASKGAYNLLRINAALNGASNITPHHLALSDTSGTCTLYHSTRNWGHSLVKARSVSDETVDCLTLGEFLDRNNIERCHFMKINCEGSEFPIILGATPEALQRFDTIVTLYHCDLWRDNTEDDLVAHLEKGGFTTEIINRRTGSKRRGWIIATRDPNR